MILNGSASELENKLGVDGASHLEFLCHGMNPYVYICSFHYLEKFTIRLAWQLRCCDSLPSSCEKRAMPVPIETETK